MSASAKSQENKMLAELEFEILQTKSQPLVSKTAGKDWAKEILVALEIQMDNQLALWR